MLSREELHNRILYVMPNAKFSFWNDDGREANYEDNSVDYVKIDGYCIAWKKENGVFPSEQILKSADKSQIDADAEAKRKAIRSKLFADNMALVGCYELEKKSNPDLSFSDYLDFLEVQMKNLKQG